jgi:hypothetical protein
VPRVLDPVYVHSRREAIIILSIWLACTVYCCTYYYLYGYSTPERPLGPDDVHPILGMPSWIFWGVMVPWLICAIITFVFAGWFIVDDDLGADHAAELETDIREGAGLE